jgi:hypothetical protein
VAGLTDADIDRELLALRDLRPMRDY